MLIALARVDAEELREPLIESWRERAPKRVLGAYDASEPQQTE